MAPITTTAIRAAIRPYSMAVAPLSLAMNFWNMAVLSL